MDVHIALGSNLGDRVGHLLAALDALEAAGLALRAVSSVWHTEAVDTTGGGAFLNMAVRVDTPRPARDVLQSLQAIERRAGRVRQERNGPRTLDLDLLLAGDLESSHPDLILPHPRMWQRRFVLAPLAEIAGGLINPSTGRSVEQELGGLPERPVARRLGELVRV